MLGERLVGSSRLVAGCVPDGFALGLEPSGIMARVG